MLSFAIRASWLPFFLFSASVSFAQNTFILENKSTTYRLDSHVEIFIDTSSTTSFEQIRSSEFQSHFQPNKNKGLTFGYLKLPLWLKVTTRNASPGTQWYLEIPAPFLEYVDLYQQNSSGWQIIETGYYKPHASRGIPHTGYVLPLEFDKDNASTVYIKITGTSPKTFPLYIMNKEVFYEKVRFEDFGYGLFFGILTVMFLYNLFIYLTLRQSNYLLYICTIICTFCIFASASGYGGKFLWPEIPIMNFYAGRISLGILAVFLSVFTIRFLEVRKYSIVMYYVLIAVIPLSAVAIVFVVTQTLSSACNNLITLSTFAYLITGIVCRIKGNRTANYFIAAWTLYLLGGALLTLRNSGVFEYNFWTTHFVEIGAAAETVIIAFALGDRYRRYKDEIEVAQALALQFQREAREKLEDKVKERTEQLTKANETLMAMLETNKQQTQIIEAKNAELDNFFYRISHDLKGPISSLLGLSSLAKLEVKDELALDYLDKQYRQVKRLNDIIKGLINLTKLNHADLKKELIDFEKLVDDCIFSFSGLPGFEKITFHKKIETSSPFHAEFVLLNAILQNLIENGIKYCGSQSPYIKISVFTEPEWLIIQVEDNGQGISEEHQSKIFEIFYRATHSSDGSGLGLYILKRSVDILKGGIALSSTRDCGSTFTVKLPFRN